MKRLIYYLVIISVGFFACNQNSNKNKADEHATEEHAAVTDTALSLNQGAKWKADSITNNNVIDLKTVAENFKIKPFPSVGDYQLLGKDLSGGVDKMIQECKMKGPDHEALHKWLEPVLEGAHQLKSVADTIVARKTFQSVDKRIDEYYNYFE